MGELRERPAVMDVLHGGGVMGGRIRAHDWSATPLGPPHAWPQSLRTALRILLSSRFAMWMAWGEDLTFFCNDAYLPTLGVKGDWALGASARKVWAEIWKDIGPRIDHVLATGEATWDQDLLLFLERSGFPEETYHTFSYSPLGDDDGRITGMLCVVTEETERVIGERRLATLADLASTLSKAPLESDMVAAVEAALGANPKDLPFTATYLFENEGRIARRFSQTHAPWGAAVPETLPVRAAAPWSPQRWWDGEAHAILELAADFAPPPGGWDEAPRRAFVSAIAHQGQARPAGFLVLGLNPYRALDRAYENFIELIAGQIAAGLANARAYEAERRRAEALAEIDAAKTQFFSNVSHEFRTPLTLMLGPLEEILEGEARPEGVTRNVETAHRNGVRLLRLVNSLLDFSRIEAGRAVARFEPTDLSAYVGELVSGFRSATDRAGLALTVAAQDGVEPVWVDRDMLEKIVLNLVSNAFKFTFDGGIAVTLSRTAEGGVELSVADTGTGIPPEELPRLFERFHRVEGAEGRSFEGSGIGLALVSELVKLHDGAISVQSTPGEGSRFAVTFRPGTGHLPTDRLAEAAPDGGATSAKAKAFVDEALRWLPAEPDERTAAPAEARRGQRILLADDNSDMRAYVARLLEQEGYEVEVAADGAQALAALQLGRPDLVLSDVMMPHLDGYGLLAAIRRDPGLADLPVLLLSARAGEEASVEGLAAGADDYLTKPFSSRELLARIGANLALAGARRAAATEARARAAELQAVLDTAPVGVWFTDDPEGRTAWSNAFAARMLRMAPDQNPSLSADEAERPAHFRLFRDGEEPDSRTLPLQRAARGEEVRDEEHEVMFDDGSRIHILVSGMPLRDPDGAVRGAIATAVDITERKRAEEHRTLLINELNHRVKNTLATVQSVALQTLSVHADADMFRDAFEARLISLSRAHDVLTQENWDGADLRDIAEGVLRPYKNAAPNQIVLGGENVRLSPKTALALAMAFHELATNAAKYGALSTSSGRVSVTWQVVPGDDEPSLGLTWRERDGPEVAPPTRRGFGSRLMERGLAQELDGEVRLDYDPAGVACWIRAPLPVGAPQPLFAPDLG